MANSYIKLARPYARAAFEYAVAHKQMNDWDVLLQTLAAFVSQPLVFNTLRNPNYTPEKLANLCFNLVDKGWQSSSKNFIRLLAEKDKLYLLPNIAQLFAQYRADSEKTIDVKVSSVVPLSTEFKDVLSETLQKKLNKQVALEYETDANLLGGLLIRAGDQVIDASLRGQLERLREAVMQ